VVLGVIGTVPTILVVIAFFVEVAILIVVLVDVVVVDPILVLGVVVVFDVVVDCLEIVCLAVVLVRLGVVAAVVLKNICKQFTKHIVSLILLQKNRLLTLVKELLLCTNLEKFIELLCINGPGSSFCGCSNGLSLSGHG